MTQNELILPGDIVFINSDDWFSNGKCQVKEVSYFPNSTQVGITTTDGHYISTAYHFVNKLKEQN